MGSFQIVGCSTSGGSALFEDSSCSPYAVTKESRDQFSDDGDDDSHGELYISLSKITELCEDTSAQTALDDNLDSFKATAPQYTSETTLVACKRDESVLSENPSKWLQIKQSKTVRTIPYRPRPDDVAEFEFIARRPRIDAGAIYNIIVCTDFTGTSYTSAKTLGALLPFGLPSLIHQPLQTMALESLPKVSGPKAPSNKINEDSLEAISIESFSKANESLKPISFISPNISESLEVTPHLKPVADENIEVISSKRLPEDNESIEIIPRSPFSDVDEHFETISCITYAKSSDVVVATSSSSYTDTAATFEIVPWRPMADSPELISGYSHDDLDKIFTIANYEPFTDTEELFEFETSVSNPGSSAMLEILPCRPCIDDNVTCTAVEGESCSRHGETNESLEIVPYRPLSDESILLDDVNEIIKVTARSSHSIIGETYMTSSGTTKHCTNAALDITPWTSSDEPHHISFEFVPRTSSSGDSETNEEVSSSANVDINDLIKLLSGGSHVITEETTEDRSGTSPPETSDSREIIPWISDIDANTAWDIVPRRSDVDENESCEELSSIAYSDVGEIIRFRTCGSYTVKETFEIAPHLRNDAKLEMQPSTPCIDFSDSLELVPYKPDHDDSELIDFVPGNPNPSTSEIITVGPLRYYNVEGTFEIVSGIPQPGTSAAIDVTPCAPDHSGSSPQEGMSLEPFVEGAQSLEVVRRASHNVAEELMDIEDENNGTSYQDQSLEFLQQLLRNGSDIFDVTFGTHTEVSGSFEILPSTSFIEDISETVEEPTDRLSVAEVMSTESTSTEQMELMECTPSQSQTITAETLTEKLTGNTDSE